MASTGPTPSNGYFVDQKKGEVNELKQVQLRLILRRVSAFLISASFGELNPCSF